MINGLDIFTGIGGLSLALREYVQPIAYCEIDPYCQAILLSRMATGDLVHAPIWDDVKTLRIRPQEVDIDIIYGGWPCQDISIAGKGKGLAGERSGLFFEIVRLCCEIEPRFLFLENVPAITSRGGTEVVRQIASMGYDCRWCIISAASVGALHKRERWFLLANSRRQRLEKGPEEIQSERKKPEQPDTNKLCWGKTESEMDRKANGIRNQLDRIKSLGNSVVPQQARKAFQMLMGIGDRWIS